LDAGSFDAGSVGLHRSGPGVSFRLSTCLRFSLRADARLGIGASSHFSLRATSVFGFLAGLRCKHSFALAADGFFLSGSRGPLFRCPFFRNLSFDRSRSGLGSVFG